jgi:hypothetical protein
MITRTITLLFTYRRHVGTAIAGLDLAKVFCQLQGATAQGCSLFGKSAWAGLEILRMVFQLTDWEAAAGYLHAVARCLPHALQIADWICRLLCASAS